MPVTVAARVLPPIVKATEAPASFVPVMVVLCSLALMMSSVATALMVGAMGAAVSMVKGFRLVEAVCPLVVTLSTGV